MNIPTTGNKLVVNTFIALQYHVNLGWFSGSGLLATTAIAQGLPLAILDIPLYTIPKIACASVKI